MNIKKLFTYIISIILLSYCNIFATWTPQSSGVTTNLNSIYTRGANVYAVGMTSTILKTTNSGTSWSSLTSPTTADFYSVFFNDAITGFIGGNLGKLYKTTDGGTSWTSQNSSTPNNIITSIAFSDASNGVLSTNAGEIRYTSTGGDTWNLATSGISTSLNSVCMIRSTDIIICGNNGKILKSINGGSTWTNITSGTTANLNSISINGTNGIIVGDGGIILNSTDEGATWTSVTSPTSQNLNKVSFGNNIRAYACGDNGTIIMSTNSGVSWTEQISSTTNKLTGLANITYLEVFAVGNTGLILHTLTGGLNLTPSLILTAPNGNVSFKNNTSQVISWTSANISDILIKYSNNNGLSYSNVMAVTASSKSFSWTVPNDLTNQALIKIEDFGNPTLFDVSDSTFSIYNWSIAISQPNSSSTWSVGSTQIINWIVENINNINIDYTTNNGTSWNNIVTNQLASTGSYSWVIPDILTANAKLRITDSQNSSKAFTMASSFLIQAPEVTLLSPNGGENLTAFTNYNITWANINVANVDLDYSTDNGLNWINIINGLNANPGTYSWNVPNLNLKAIIRVKSSIKSSVNDVSNSSFTIIGFPIIVSTPNGGENWQAGSQKIITWSATNDVVDVNIDYSTSNGGAWTRIANSVSASSNSFNWTIPSNFTTQALIRVADSFGSSTFADVSNNVFTISNLQLSSGLTNLTVIAGATQNITWSSFSAGNLSIYYSLDNGINWINIVSNLSSSITNYNWATPIITPQIVKLKIQNSTDPNIKSETNLNFVNQSLAVTAPVSNDYLQTSKNKVITWTSSYINTIKIDYSIDGGLNWINIGSNITAPSGSYTWSVPNSISINTFIRLGYIKPSSNTYTYAQSNLFNITNATVTLTSPNGGEKLIANSIQKVNWTSANITSLDLFYSSDNGANWNLIVSGINGALKSYNWTVPNAPSKLVLIKIRDSNRPGIEDISDANFSITGVTLKSPLSNEKLLVNGNTNISWISNEVNKVNLYYSIDNGIKWIEIIRNYPASGGNYTWQVPNNPSVVAKLRIIDAQNSSLKDSSVNLTMQGMVITSPKKGDTLLIGDNSNITWRSADIGDIKIDYTINGTTWVTVNSNVDATLGTYSWEVPETQSNTAQLRLTHLMRPDFIDVSSNFIIYGDGIVIKSPKTGDILTSATSKTITWSSSNTDIVKIECSSNNGATWKLIADSVLASQKNYVWTVADSSSRDYLIKISDAENPDIKTISGRFSVRGVNGFKVPQSWNFASMTGSTAIAIIPNINGLIIPKILDSNITQGSAIGVFYTVNGIDYCAGYKLWDSTKNNALTIWGDNPQTSVKDGYAIGETLTFKIWDSQNGIEYNATVSYSQGTGLYANDGVYVLSSIRTHKSLNIPLTGGKWSLISSNLIPNDLKIASMLSGIKPNMEYVKNDAGNTYYPAQNLNTITNWNMSNGYQIYMNNNDTLKIKGINVNVLNYGLTIVQDAWQIISFLPKDSMAASTLFPSFPFLRMAKDQDGSIYYPAYNINNIGFMKPGYGYKLNSGLSFTFFYPSGSGAIAPVVNNNSFAFQLLNETPTNYIPNMKLTGNSAVIVINSNEAEIGDEFGIFSSKGLLIGSALYNPKGSVITMWGDDISTKVKTDGAIENEPLIAKLWKKKTNKEYNLAFDNIADIINGKIIQNGLKYKQDAIYQTDVKINGISDVENDVLDNEISISPNPAKKFANVLFKLDDNRNVNIEIYNTVGQLLKSFDLGYRLSGLVNYNLDIDELQTGVYLLSIKTGEKVRTEKLIIHD